MEIKQHSGSEIKKQHILIWTTFFFLLSCFLGIGISLECW